MSRVAITASEPGEDARDAADIGAIFDSFEAASTDVDDEVVAEEGLDERSIADRAMSEVLITQANTGPTVSNNAAYATTQIGGNFRTGGFTVPAGYKAKVVATMNARPTAGQDSINAGYVAARLRYSIAGVPTAIANTERFVGGRTGTVGGGTSGGGDFTLGTVLGPGTYDWIEVQSFSSDVVNHQLDNGTIFIEAYYLG